jgi:8-oxo-dGTP pyrophosphatase MutT (NUDIX family)
VTEPPEELKWKVHGRRSVYDNRWVKVDLVDVEPPDGSRFEHHVVRTLWRYRFAVDQWGYELIGGLVEEGEEPAVTAAREAVEETGWKPVGEPEHIGTFQPLPGIIDSPVDAFVWRAAEKVGEPTDGEEAARIEWIPVDRALDLVRRGEVLGSGAIVPLLYYLASRAGASSGSR